MSKKRVAELDTPFTGVEWPVVSPDDQDTILELLCTLLAPLGQYRRDHVRSSRGKRRRRTRRNRAAVGSKDVGGTETTNLRPAVPSKQRDGQEKASGSGPSTQASSRPPPPLVPPPPELASFVDVGLSDITRELSRLSESAMQKTIKSEREQLKQPEQPEQPPSSSASSSPSSNPSPPSSSPYVAIFVARSGHPPAFYSHFPQMVAVASRGDSKSSEDNSESGSSAAATSSPIRLVGFSKSCEERLSTSLGIPHVSAIAIREGAAQAQGLINFVRERVSPVDVCWLKEAREGKYRETNIHMAEVSIGPKKKKT